MDLSAAYDVLNPDIFIKKAEVLKIGGIALKWLQSFLTGRSQVVEVGNEMSDRRNLDVGTPQGSPLSCLIFSIYVGDFSLWFDQDKDSLALAYADDSFLSVVAKTEEALRERLQSIGEKVMSFFASNELVANADETGLLIIRPHKRKNDPLTINIGGAHVVESSKEKLLGVKIQSDLKWDTHAKTLRFNLQYRVGVLQRLKYELKQFGRLIS